MITHSSRPILALLSLFLFLGLVSLSCQISAPAASPTYVEAIYYRTYPTPGTTGKTDFQFLQLYYHGVFTFVDIGQSSAMTVEQVHDQIAVSWLEPNAVPDHTGNYVILGNRIYLNYPPVGADAFPATQSSGTYSASRINLSNADCSSVEYLRYPPGNAAPLATATSQPCEAKGGAPSGGQAGTGTPAGGQPSLQVTRTPSVGQQVASCQLGTWRVNAASYLAWMNAVENKDPSITFTKIPMPFHYRFNADGSFTVYYDKGSSLSFDAKAAATGKVMSTEIDYSSGTLGGTFSLLKPDPSFPGFALMTITIAQNSITVVGMKANGISVPQVSALNITPMVEPAFFKKVGYICKGDTLGMIPLAAGLPSGGYELSRDSSWQPTGP